MKDYKNMKIFINDNGNETIKGLDENFEKIHFFNIIAPITDAEAKSHIKTEQRFKQKRDSVYDCLDVTIHKDGKRLGRFYIGNLATEYFNTKAERRNQNINKAEAEQTYICSSVSTALNLIKLNSDKGHINAGNVFMGGLLPMEEFKEDDLVDVMVTNLKGDFKLEFHRDMLEGKIVEFRADEEDIFVFPESGIGLDGLQYNEDGTKNKEFLEKTKDRYVIGFDIGSIDTDMAGMKNGSPIPKLCDDVGEGITQALNRIKKVVEPHIKDEYKRKVEITTDELSAVILGLGCKYPLGADNVDIKEFVDTELNRSVKSILSEFDNRIDTNMTNKIYGIWNFGGGSILMKELIESRLKGRFNIENVEDPIWFNVHSAIKVAKNTRLEMLKNVEENKNN